MNENENENFTFSNIEAWKPTNLLQTNSFKKDLPRILIILIVFSH